MLPLVFLARFDESEDDFVAGTFFAHPEPDGPVDPAGPLGTGLRVFAREDKRYCGSLYLRPNRTGSRALSFQRGSLLDTVVRLEADIDGGTWEQALDAVRGLVLTDEGSGFARTREAVAGRIRDFLRLDPEGPGAEVLAGELTREHLREVLRLFVAAEPLAHPGPRTGAAPRTLGELREYVARGLYPHGMATCVQCGQAPEDGFLSRTGLCDACGVINVVESMRQQSERNGPIYDRQRVAVARRRPGQ